MKTIFINMLQDFLDGKMGVSSFTKELEEWNQSGFWNELTKTEYNLMSDYYRNYADMYYGEILPQKGFWDKIKQKMQGMPDVDLEELKKGTSILLKKLQEKHKG